MNCDELKELISAYADGELPLAQRDFVEEHLSHCADCQTVYTAHKNTGQQMSALRVTPPLPDITAAVMSRIKFNKILRKPSKWLRPVLVVAPVMSILIILSSLYLAGYFLHPASVLAKAYTTTDNVTSFRMESIYSTKYPKTGNIVLNGSSSLEYAGENLMHFTFHSPEGNIPPLFFETIFINNNGYIKLPAGDSWSMPDPILNELAAGPKDIPGKEQTLGTLTSLVDLKQMQDEKLDGINCLHYLAHADKDKLIKEEQTLVDKNILKTIKTLELRLRTRTISVEIWVGKDDYLIHRMKIIDGPLQTSQQNISEQIYIDDVEYIEDIKFSDFNQPLIIQAPLDVNGKLPDGWKLFTITKNEDGTYTITTN